MSERALLPAALGEWLNGREDGHAGLGELVACLRELRLAGLDDLPLPGSGQTLQRWRALSCVASHDLNLCKLYEGHTDALAVMAELGAPAPAEDSLWGMWAAEPPQAKVRIVAESGGEARLDGVKAWCSGADQLTHGLLTAWDANGEQQLVAVKMEQPGVSTNSGSWQAIGMGATQSVEVSFRRAHGVLVGGPGDYLRRPGFWQGGGGIAACWYGAAQALAEYLRGQGHRGEPHTLAHLGAVDAALQASAALLRDCAAWIDRNPTASAEMAVRRSRAVCEDAAESLLRHVGRALGAAPLCLNRRYARLATDLPVLLRQSHAERDLAALGELVAKDPAGSWLL